MNRRLVRLRWLQQRGCPMGHRLLCAALQHADLHVAQWMVDEGVCKVPGEGTGGGTAWD